MQLIKDRCPSGDGLALAQCLQGSASEWGLTKLRLDHDPGAPQFTSLGLKVRPMTDVDAAALQDQCKLYVAALASLTAAPAPGQRAAPVQPEAAAPPAAAHAADVAALSRGQPVRASVPAGRVVGASAALAGAAAQAGAWTLAQGNEAAASAGQQGAASAAADREHAAVGGAIAEPADNEAEAAGVSAAVEHLCQQNVIEDCFEPAAAGPQLDPWGGADAGDCNEGASGEAEVPSVACTAPPTSVPGQHIVSDQADLTSEGLLGEDISMSRKQAVSCPRPHSATHDQTHAGTDGARNALAGLCDQPASTMVEAAVAAASSGQDASARRTSDAAPKGAPGGMTAAGQAAEERVRSPAVEPTQLNPLLSATAPSPAVSAAPLQRSQLEPAATQFRPAWPPRLPPPAAVVPTQHVVATSPPNSGNAPQRRVADTQLCTAPSPPAGPHVPETRIEDTQVIVTASQLPGACPTPGQTAPDTQVNTAVMQSPEGTASPDQQQTAQQHNALRLGHSPLHGAGNQAHGRECAATSNVAEAATAAAAMHPVIPRHAASVRTAGAAWDAAARSVGGVATEARPSPAAALQPQAAHPMHLPANATRRRSPGSVRGRATPAQLTAPNASLRRSSASARQRSLHAPAACPAAAPSNPMAAAPSAPAVAPSEAGARPAPAPAPTSAAPAPAAASPATATTQPVPPAQHAGLPAQQAQHDTGLGGGAGTLQLAEAQAAAQPNWQHRPRWSPVEHSTIPGHLSQGPAEFSSGGFIRSGSGASPQCDGVVAPGAGAEVVEVRNDSSIELASQAAARARAEAALAAYAREVSDEDPDHGAAGAGAPAQQAEAATGSAAVGAAVDASVDAAGEGGGGGMDDADEAARRSSDSDEHDCVVIARGAIPAAGGATAASAAAAPAAADATAASTGPSPRPGAPPPRLFGGKDVPADSWPQRARKRARANGASRAPGQAAPDQAGQLEQPATTADLRAAKHPVPLEPDVADAPSGLRARIGSAATAASDEHGLVVRAGKRVYAAAASDAEEVHSSDMEAPDLQHQQAPEADQEEDAVDPPVLEVAAAPSVHVRLCQAMPQSAPASFYVKASSCSMLLLLLHGAQACHLDCAVHTRCAVIVVCARKRIWHMSWRCAGHGSRGAVCALSPKRDGALRPVCLGWHRHRPGQRSCRACSPPAHSCAGTLQTREPAPPRASSCPQRRTRRSHGGGARQHVPCSRWPTGARRACAGVAAGPRFHKRCVCAQLAVLAAVLGPYGLGFLAGNFHCACWSAVSLCASCSVPCLRSGVRWSDRQMVASEGAPDPQCAVQACPLVIRAMCEVLRPLHGNSCVCGAQGAPPTNQ
jgi:hypothetical protein